MPIWVAASGPLAAAMAGQIAEGFICTSGKNPQLYTELTGKVGEGLARARREHASLEKMIEVKVSFDTDVARAKEDTRHWAALALTPEEKVGVEDPMEMERLAAALPLDRAASRWIVSADPQEQVEQDPALCRARLQPPRVPCARPRPGPLSEALRRTGIAIAACQVRLMSQIRLMNHEVTIHALTGIKLVEPGDDLGAITIDAFVANRLAPQDGDVLVVAQKIVSKAEGRYVDVQTVEPSERAMALAAEIDKDPRFVEVVLSESKRVVRHRPGLLIVEHRLGFVMANAGIDHSNIPTGDGDDRVLLLPEDPDGSARALRQRIIDAFGVTIGVVISDSFGRAWRKGTVGIALGAAGLPAVIDMRGRPDLFGRELLVTETGFADEIAAAAGLLMGQADEALPMVLVRGLRWSAPDLPAAALIRPAEHDLFR